MKHFQTRWWPFWKCLKPPILKGYLPSMVVSNASIFFHPLDNISKLAYLFFHVGVTQASAFAEDKMRWVGERQGNWIRPEGLLQTPDVGGGCWPGGYSRTYMSWSSFDTYWLKNDVWDRCRSISYKGWLDSPKWMFFWKTPKRPLTPPPRFWKLHCAFFRKNLTKISRFQI